MISAFDLTAVLSIGLLVMVSAVGMGVYLYKYSEISK